MKIVVVEDQGIFREIIVRACGEHGHEVVGETGSGNEALVLCHRLQPELLLLDLGLPDINGVTVAEAVRRELPKTKILVLSGHREAYWLYRLERLAIEGFIDKNRSAVVTIGHALTAIAEGQRWFSPIFHQSKETQRSDPNSFAKKLTPREQAILAYVAQGKSDDQIGYLLGISPRTVEDHCTNLRRKLNLEDTRRLIGFALEKGFF